MIYSSSLEDKILSPAEDADPVPPSIPVDVLRRTAIPAAIERLQKFGSSGKRKRFITNRKKKLIKLSNLTKNKLEDLPSVRVAAIATELIMSLAFIIADPILHGKAVKLIVGKNETYVFSPLDFGLPWSRHYVYFHSVFSEEK